MKNTHPDHKYNRGDLVSLLTYKYIVQSAGGHWIRNCSNGDWEPVYRLCPLNKAGNAPDKRTWNARYSFRSIEAVKMEIELIESNFYTE